MLRTTAEKKNTTKNNLGFQRRKKRHRRRKKRYDRRKSVYDRRKNLPVIKKYLLLKSVFFYMLGHVGFTLPNIIYNEGTLQKRYGNVTKN